MSLKEPEDRPQCEEIIQVWENGKLIKRRCKRRLAKGHKFCDWHGDNAGRLVPITEEELKALR